MRGIIRKRGIWRQGNRNIAPEPSFGRLSLSFSVSALRQLQHSDLVAVEGTDDRVALLIRQSNLDHSGHRRDLGHIARTFLCFHATADRRRQAKLLFIGAVFVIETAHESTARAGNFRRVE